MPTLEILRSWQLHDTVVAIVAIIVIVVFMAIVAFVAVIVLVSIETLMKITELYDANWIGVSAVCFETWVCQ